MTRQPLDVLAGQLLSARESGIPLSALDWPELSFDEIYTIQDLCAAKGNWFREGSPRAWKVGCASRAAEPNCAPLPDSGLLDSGAILPRSHLPLLGIEAEVALRVGRDISDANEIGAEPQAVEALIDAICVTIEVISSRFNEGAQTPSDRKLADLQLHGALIIGEPTTFVNRDWSTQRCTVEVNSRLVADVQGTHPVGDPFWTTHWLLEHALRRYGRIRKGDLITTGTWAGIIPVRPGDFVAVRFDGIGETLLKLGA